MKKNHKSVYFIASRKIKAENRNKTAKQNLIPEFFYLKKKKTWQI